MKQVERQKEILDLVQRGKCTSVKELCTVIYASPATIRRDLRELEEKALVRLHYGYIIPLTEKAIVPPLAYREHLAKVSKQAVARYAASLIPPNSSVLLDASSTTMYIADYLNPDHGIVVFTNCIKTAMKLCERDIRFYLIGGLVDTKNLITSGSWTIDDIRKISADYFFFSSMGLDRDGNISTQSESGVGTRKYMMEHSKQQYFLCTSEKVGSSYTFTLGNTKDVTSVIIDTDISFIPDTNFINIHEITSKKRPR